MIASWESSRSSGNDGLSPIAEFTEEQIQARLSVAQYGDLILPDAVRPAPNTPVNLCRGYRHDESCESRGIMALFEEASQTLPVLTITESRGKIMELFKKLIKPLGERVDAILETHHNYPGGGNQHGHLYHMNIDMPDMQRLLSAEDVLLNDGYAGLVIRNPETYQEAQLEDHKLIRVFHGDRHDAYRRILEDNQVPCKEGMKVISEQNHFHFGRWDSAERFFQLAKELGFI